MANPAMNEETFTPALGEEGTMTLEGTINKSIILIGITILSAIMTWMYVDMSILAPYLLPIIIGTAVFSFVIFFKKELSPYLAPVFAVVEGVVIAVFSALFEMQYPGIVMQAATATFAIFAVMLLMYRARIIQVTQKFRSMVMAATGAIMLLYVISILGSLTGWYQVPLLHSNGPLGIGISVFIVGIASFNLLLDFDVIEHGVAAKAPKWMEWYASFGLLVTLVWLYIEVLRLLSKLRSR
ncbi:Bax inhibitor-1/YccA family protein [Candidatus Gracilibacteria bacterium]|nr:Bax inhibitor-1/YccA family protein [Candidatus Gracilibacteria bacterium]